MKKMGWIGVVMLPAFVSLQAAPKISCDDIVHDFGRILNTNITAHTFILTNTGDEPLVIESTKASCGCTVAEVSTKNIAPGGSAELVAKVNLQGRFGKQSKKVTVTSNDPAKRTLILTMKGEAYAPYSLSPHHAYFKDIPAGTSAEFEVTITSDKGPFDIKPIASLPDPYSIKVVKLEKEQGYRLLIKVHDQAKLGRHYHRLVMETTINGHTEVPLPISAYVIGDIGFEPAKIVLKENGSKPVSRYIGLRPGKIKEFDVLEIEMPDPEMKAKASKYGSNIVRIHMTNLIAKPALRNAKMRIKTSSPDQPWIEVPFEYIP